MAGDEVRISNVLDRVDRLKESNLWSFKQLKRQAHPPRQKVQWDYMLEEMVIRIYSCKEWMSEDFRQERRWKIANAYNLAKWVKEWHDAVDKAALCYNPSSPRYLEEDDERIPKDGEFDHSKNNTIEIVTELAEEIFEKGAIDEASISQVAASIEAENSIGVDPSIALENPGQSSVEVIHPNPFKVPRPLESKSIDPQSLSLPININLDSNCYTLESFTNTNRGLSHLPTYGPPVVKEGDQCFEDDSIVPISKFMLADFTVPSPISWDQFGKRQESPISVPPVKILPSDQTYTPLPSRNRKFLFDHSIVW